MSEPAAFVAIDLAGTTRPIGRLWTSGAGVGERASFELDPTWLAEPVHYALGPVIPPARRAFHSGEGRGIFGALGDSAPDRWGRTLITQAEAQRARKSGEPPRSPREIEFLLGATDLVRQGALRFSVTEGGPYLADHGTNPAPPLANLGSLLAAALVIEDYPDSTEAGDAVRLLLAPGSSLGGARPKASVSDRDGALAIAKFPKSGDPVDVVRWEAVMLSLAKRAGIPVAVARIELAGDRPVLVVRRFDRDAGARIPFLSARSLLAAGERERRSYVEMADALRRIASHASAELPQLWRRMAFNILASNFDDHLRNHGVIFDGAGWRLSPAYDLNPEPQQAGPRQLATPIAVDGDRTASIELAVEAAAEFRLTRDEARSIAADVAESGATWRDLATRAGLNGAELEQMATAFEHSEAASARRWK